MIAPIYPTAFHPTVAPNPPPPPLSNGFSPVIRLGLVPKSTAMFAK